jgi:hypothetical protein
MYKTKLIILRTIEVLFPLKAAVPFRLNFYFNVVRFYLKYIYVWKVLKCGVGEGWRRSVGPIM